MAKLVRNRIPELIENDGRTAHTRILGKDEFVEFLDEKLKEETKEYLSSGNLEELADILEVVNAIALARGHSLEELEETRAMKALEKGSFSRRILLESVTDDNYGL